MSNLQLIKRQSKSKPPIFAGIDVGAEELVLAVRKDGKPFDPQEFANTPKSMGSDSLLSHSLASP
ncbi:hypothetical protein [Methyloglobulus sp.]|uniref:hypothetical protein n=1 Tax=Methyloglobulus sp. TaxID=2518622 RepID=UPI0039895D7E